MSTVILFSNMDIIKNNKIICPNANQYSLARIPGIEEFFESDFSMCGS